MKINYLIIDLNYEILVRDLIDFFASRQDIFVIIIKQIR